MMMMSLCEPTKVARDDRLIHFPKWTISLTCLLSHSGLIRGPGTIACDRTVRSKPPIKPPPTIDQTLGRAYAHPNIIGIGTSFRCQIEHDDRPKFNLLYIQWYCGRFSAAKNEVYALCNCNCRKRWVRENACGSENGMISGTYSKAQAVVRISHNKMPREH